MNKQAYSGQSHVANCQQSTPDCNFENCLSKVSYCQSKRQAGKRSDSRISLTTLPEHKIIIIKPAIVATWEKTDMWIMWSIFDGPNQMPMTPALWQSNQHFAGQRC